MPPFQLEAPYKPTGDQGPAIDALAAGLEAGRKHQALLGVTGSGKTFTMANVIARVQKPTLVLVHNKTLAGQLYQEFKQFFPHNAVEYFISYYDYYQPEAYLPQTDTYIAKDSSINDAIDQMRHAATTSLLQRNDVLIVSSVSCIYGLGSPEVYHGMVVYLEEGMESGASRFSPNSSTSSTHAMMSISIAGRSVPAAMSSKFFPPRMRPSPSASNCSATWSTPSMKSIP